MYVIAGYQKFIPIENINDDECIRQTKKRIVTKVIPKGNNLDVFSVVFC